MKPFLENIEDNTLTLGVNEINFPVILVVIT